MAGRSWTFLCVAAAGALALGACSKHSDVDANAPVSPGTGNGVAVVKPSAPDSPAGGPNGISGSLSHPGASGGDAIPGTSGKGTDTASGSKPAAPGVGLNGGLGAGSANVASSTPGAGSTTSAPTGTGPDSTLPGGNGSPNTTTHSSVGNR